MLAGVVSTGIAKTGLNAFSGVLHAWDSSRESLVYDLMEEFRAPIVDRAVISLFGKGWRPAQTKDDWIDRQSIDRIIEAVRTALVSRVCFRGKDTTMADVILAQAEAVRAHLRNRSRYRHFRFKW